MNKARFALPLLFAVVALGMSSIFVVDEREKALVLQFGEVKQVKEDPGLGFKLPKGYLYAAIGFSIAIEFFNHLMTRNR